MAPPRQFKPYGTPPLFDLDEYKDTFEVWYQQWTLFLAPFTIDTVLDDHLRSEYKKTILLSCLSNATLTTVLNMGTVEEMRNFKTIIDSFASGATQAATSMSGGTTSRPGNALERPSITGYVISGNSRRSAILLATAVLIAGEQPQR